GLTDLVDSATIRDLVGRFAGRPHDVVDALIRDANKAGGKDNVTVVYVEGELFAEHQAALERGGAAPVGESLPKRREESVDQEPRGRWGRIVRATLVALLLAVAGYEAYRAYRAYGFDWRRVLPPRAIAMPPDATGQIVVTPSDSISAAMSLVPAGGSVLVE